MEELTRIMSEDIETQIHKLEAQNSDCQDLKMWYLDCIGTIRNVLDSIDELQEVGFCTAVLELCALSLCNVGGLPAGAA